MRLISSIVTTAIASLILFSVPVQAETVPITGITKDTSIRLTGVQEHDIYEDVYVSQTCSREVSDGYDEVCGHVRDHICHTGTDGIRQCEPISRWECTQVVRTRTEYYDCSYTERRWAGTELDYYVTANVDLTFDIPQGAKPNELLSIDLSHGSVSIDASRTSRAYLIFLDTQEETEISGMQKTLTVKATVKLVPSRTIVESFAAGFGYSEVAFGNGKISFTLAKHLFSDQMRFSLDLRRQRTLWFSKKVFDGAVKADAVTVEERGKLVQYTIDLAKLGLREDLRDGKKYKFELSAALSDQALRGCINAGDLGDHGSVTLKKKGKKN